MAGACKPLDDLRGQQFGFLTVVERAPNDVYHNTYWRCVCRCGETKLIRGNGLRMGKFFTCGKTKCRFWSKVHVPEGPGCWEWVGTLNDSGYGLFHIGPGQPRTRAHIFSWELANGPILDDSWVLHECDNRKCVKPDDLFLGTHEDNMRDMADKGRARVAKVFLSPVEKAQMVTDYQHGGFTYPILAERHGVSLQTVGRTLRRESRKEN